MRLTKILGYLLFLSIITVPYPWLKIDLGIMQVPIASFIIFMMLIVGVFIKLTRRDFQIPLGGYFWFAGVFVCSLIIPMFLADNKSLELASRYAYLCFVVPFTILIQDFEKKDIQTFLFIIIIVNLFFCISGFYTYFEKDCLWFQFRNDTAGDYAVSVRNSDAYYMESAFFIALTYFIFGKKRIVRIGSLILSGMFGLATVLIFSRGAWIASLIGIAFLIYVSQKCLRNKVSVLGKLAIISGIIISGMLFFDFGDITQMISQRFSTIFALDNSSSNYERVLILEFTLNLLSDDPLYLFTGIGRDVLELNYYWFENAYLQVLIENGILGLTAFTGMMLYPIVKLFSLMKKELKNREAFTIVCVLTVLVCWFVNMIFTMDFSLYFIIFNSLGLALISYYNRQANCTSIPIDKQVILDKRDF